MKKSVSLIKLNAGNDRNGNPRRCYLAIGSDGLIVGVWDEAYRGYNAVPEEYRSQAQTCHTFATTAGEYRDLMRGGYWNGKA